jgi:hypothetical protein
MGIQDADIFKGFIYRYRIMAEEILNHSYDHKMCLFGLLSTIEDLEIIVQCVPLTQPS